MLGTIVGLGNSARKVKIKNRISKESNMVTYPGHVELANQDTNKHSSGALVLKGQEVPSASLCMPNEAGRSGDEATPSLPPCLRP